MHTTNGFQLLHGDSEFAVAYHFPGGGPKLEAGEITVIENRLIQQFHIPSAKRGSMQFKSNLTLILVFTEGHDPREEGPR